MKETTRTVTNKRNANTKTPYIYQQQQKRGRRRRRICREEKKGIQQRQKQITNNVYEIGINLRIS